MQRQLDESFDEYVEYANSNLKFSAAFGTAMSAVMYLSENLEPGDLKYILLIAYVVAHFVHTQMWNEDPERVKEITNAIDSAVIGTGQIAKKFLSNVKDKSLAVLDFAGRFLSGHRAANSVVEAKAEAEVGVPKQRPKN